MKKFSKIFKKSHDEPDAPVDLTVNIPKLKLNAPVKSKFQKVKSTIKKILPIKKSQPKPKVKKIKPHFSIKNKLFRVKSKYEGKKLRFTSFYRIYKIYFGSFFKPEVPDLDISWEESECILYFTPPPRIIEESDTIRRTEFFDDMPHKLELTEVHPEVYDFDISRLYDEPKLNPLFKVQKCKKLPRQAEKSRKLSRKAKKSKKLAQKLMVEYENSSDADIESNDEVTDLNLGSALYLKEDEPADVELQEWSNTMKVENFLDQLETHFGDCAFSLLEQSTIISGQSWYEPVPQEQTGFSFEWNLPLENPNWEHIAGGEDAMGSRIWTDDTSSYYGTIDESIPDDAEWPSFDIRNYRRTMVFYNSYIPDSPDCSGEDPFWTDDRFKKKPVFPGPFCPSPDETHCSSVREDTAGGTDCDDSYFIQVATGAVVGTTVTNPENVEPKQHQNEDDKVVFPSVSASMLDFLSERVEKNYCYPVRDVGNCPLLSSEPSLLSEDDNFNLAVEDEVDSVEEEFGNSSELLETLETKEESENSPELSETLHTKEEETSLDTIEDFKPIKSTVEVETILDSEFDVRGSQVDQAYDSRKGIRLLEWKKDESHEVTKRASLITLVNSLQEESSKRPKRFVDMKGIGQLIRLFENFGKTKDNLSLRVSTPTLVD